MPAPDEVKAARQLQQVTVEIRGAALEIFRLSGFSGVVDFNLLPEGEKCKWRHVAIRAMHIGQYPIAPPKPGEISKLVPLTLKCTSYQFLIEEVLNLFIQLRSEAATVHTDPRYAVLQPVLGDHRLIEAAIFALDAAGK